MGVHLVRLVVVAPTMVLNAQSWNLNKLNALEPAAKRHAQSTSLNCSKHLSTSISPSLRRQKQHANILGNGEARKCFRGGNMSPEKWNKYCFVLLHCIVHVKMSHPCTLPMHTTIYSGCNAMPFRATVTITSQSSIVHTPYHN